jgi:hypothetical protein
VSAREIDLALEEIRDLTTSLIEPRDGEPFGLYAYLPDDPGAAAARYVERQIFGEAFGNTPDLLAQEYGRYEDTSIFFTVIDHRRRIPVGVTRAIMPSPAGMKSLDDIARDWGQPADEVWARAGLPPEQHLTWDCATLGTLPDYRQGALFGLISMALYHPICALSTQWGFRWWVAIIDAPVLRVIQWRVGRPFIRYPGVPDMPYLGSPASVPVYADLDAWVARLRTKQPELYDVVFHADGLAPALSTPDWLAVEARIRTRRPDLLPTAAPIRDPASGPLTASLEV